MSGIYIHIPFCKQACHYCNFHFATSLRLKDELVAALTNEILISAPLVKNLFAGQEREQIDTIYFGGGTPSILNVTDLQLIMAALHKRFAIAPEAEVTLEANPDDITTISLRNWKQLGINRLSVGIQSFQEKELQWMNRAHTSAESVHCLKLIEEAGFSNYSIDLIYGSPLLDDAAWKTNVDLVINSNVPHISCYALTVEPKTALEKMIRQQKKVPVDAARQASQFIMLMQWMEEAGYEHYEISNFARPGFRSLHNSSYWQGKLYYGFGPAAHSFDGKSRRWNIANNALYIQSLKKNSIPFEAENLTETQQLNEYIMTALRTIEGLDLTKLGSTFGATALEAILKTSKKWLAGQKLVERNNHLILTNEGKLFADGIAADLFC